MAVATKSPFKSMTLLGLVLMAVAPQLAPLVHVIGSPEGQAVMSEVIQMIGGGLVVAGRVRADTPLKL